MSTIKVDTIATRTGSGNITLSNSLASATIAGNVSITSDTATLTLTDSSSHSANTGPAISFFSNDSGGASREVAKIVGESHSGANEGNLALQTRNGGTLETKWKLFKNGNLIPSNSAYGIVLGNTTSTDANLLDDFEEGTWTAGISAGSGSIALQGSFQTGLYTKIGDMVYINLHMRVGAISGNSGTLAITGLPFATPNDTKYRFSGTCSAHFGLTGVTTGDRLMPYMSSNSSNMIISNANGNSISSNSNSYMVANQSEMYLTMCYKTS